MRATVLSGSGRYQDEWHDFAATSTAIAAALSHLDLDVTVVPTTPEGLRAVVVADLVVVNAGCGSPGPGDAEDEWGPAFDILRAHRKQSRPVLAVHAAANSLDGLDEWAQWIGGRWNRQHSMHPPIGDAQVEVSDRDHLITAGLDPFVVHDERYSHLDVHDGVRRLLHHEHEGADHPLVWVHEVDGARAVYDALGHDVDSYRSPERVEVLRREVRWLLRDERSSA